MTNWLQHPPRHNGRQEHLDWLSLTEVSGPFLTVPVLTRVWPSLESIDRPTLDALKLAHATANTDPAAWIHWVFTGLLGWGDALNTAPTATLAVTEHESTVTAAFALDDPDTKRTVLLGMRTPAGQHPAARMPEEAWAATPIDRMAMLCRAEAVELGLVTDGRWWALVWAPRGKVTTSAVFDSVTWPEFADRLVVRAFRSLLERRRFFGVPVNQRLPNLLTESADNQEEITERLGVQVRQAVELLVQAIGRDEQRSIKAGGPGLEDVSAGEVYAGAVTVMMRIVFLLYAEERGLLPADNDVYEMAYSAARLGDQLQARADDAGEESLQNSYTGWYRLLALFGAVYTGIQHPRLTLHAYDGSIFEPTTHAWLTDLRVDDQAVLHILAAVQQVTIRGETRRLSFRSLDVEQIGYVYEGLLAYDGLRADDVVIGLIGRPGSEEEVSLAHLEKMYHDTQDDEELGELLASTYKTSGIGSAKAVAGRLTELSGADLSAAEGRLAAVTANDIEISKRLMPFYGVIRQDLRGLPVVIRTGGLYVGRSSLRASTGTHYTPKDLAQQIVEGALEPLLYSRGPLQTPNKDEWFPKTSVEILALKVADIAMGSGAFLVAACRYLGGALVEAWAREGDQRAKAAVQSAQAPGTIDTEVDPVIIEARRQIIEHCLYGVDINAKAVEMAKLSLWLVSMDPKRPFAFLDDRLMAGDALLGISSIEQLEYLHLDPARGRQLHGGGLIDLTTGIRDLVRQAGKDRAMLAAMPGDTLADLTAKRSHLATVQEHMRVFSRYADLLTAASLAYAGNGPVSLDIASNRALTDVRRLRLGGNQSCETVDKNLAQWLATDLLDGGSPRSTFHWPLAFPEASDAGGFDAIVGNPPFLGGKKISSANGSAYREYLVQAIGGGVKGNADLVAYFVLRAHDLLTRNGQAGLIATNTLGQGDTREVSLDQIVASGSEIRMAIKSEPWPSKSAILQYCVIWLSSQALARSSTRTLDGRSVPGITTSLDVVSRGKGIPNTLAESKGVAFIGSYVLGIGFTMKESEARGMIEVQSRNAAVLFPFINGHDLNSRPDSTASRWIVDFREMDEGEARSFAAPWEWVYENVLPERRTKDVVKYPRMVLEWWKYWNARPAMLKALVGLDSVILLTRVSKVVMPVMVSTQQVFSDATVVFAADDLGLFALLSSAPHYWWAITRASTMKGDLRYTPTDVFATLARPRLTDKMRSLGVRLDSFRRELMLSRQTGLTATYNLVHSPTCIERGIIELREIHRLIDLAVCAAYGWNDLVAHGLDHGFHDTRQGIRYTVGPTVRQEILDRLLELNHERYAAEQKSGVGSKKNVKRPGQHGLVA